MPCDLNTQRKRLAFERRVDESAPCRAAFGFANHGSFPLWYWVLPREVQPTPWFNFLNGGVLVRYNPAFPDESVFDFGALLPPRDVRLTFVGGNETQVGGDPPGPFSVAAFIRIGGVNPGDPLDNHVETSSLIALAPDPASTWSFGNWVNQIPGGPSPTFVGVLDVTPLKQCHDCETGT